MGFFNKTDPNQATKKSSLKDKLLAIKTRLANEYQQKQRLSKSTNQQQTTTVQNNPQSLNTVQGANIPSQVIAKVTTKKSPFGKLNETAFGKILHEKQKQFQNLAKTLKGKLGKKTQGAQGGTTSAKGKRIVAIQKFIKLKFNFGGKNKLLALKSRKPTGSGLAIITHNKFLTKLEAAVSIKNIKQNVTKKYTQSVIKVRKTGVAIKQKSIKSKENIINFAKSKHKAKDLKRGAQIIAISTHETANKKVVLKNSTWIIFFIVGVVILLGAGSAIAWYLL